MKEQIIRILENRATKFQSINHSFEAREVRSAIDTIKRLVPSELFVMHDVVGQSEVELCECNYPLIRTGTKERPEYCGNCGKDI